MEDIGDQHFVQQLASTELLQSATVFGCQIVVFYTLIRSVTMDGTVGGILFFITPGVQLYDSSFLFVLARLSGSFY